MPDTLSPLLQLILQSDGENDNTWGQKANDTFELIEQAIAAGGTIATTGGPTSLTNDEARNAVLTFTGTLLSNATITVPTRNKIWLVDNQTAGAFSLYLKTSGQASPGVLIPRRPVQVFCNGTIVKMVEGPQVTHVGAFFHSFNASEENALICDGTLYSVATYPELFAKIGNFFGGDGISTFGVPDLRDKYFRGAGATLTNGLSYLESIKNHVHPFTSNSDGAHTHPVSGSTDSQGDHAHNQGEGVNYFGRYGQASGLGNANIPSTSGLSGLASITSTAGAHTHTVTGTASSAGGHTHTGTTDNNTGGGTETRPYTFCANVFIRIR